MKLLYLKAAVAALTYAFLSSAPLMAQDDTGRYAFTQDYSPDPAIWVLEDEDTTIYLFGTVHALPADFEWRSEQLDTIIHQADELVLETSDYSLPQNPVDVWGKMAHRMERRAPTSQGLTPAGQAKWEKLIDISGLTYEDIDAMPLMLALLTLSLTGSLDQMASPFYGVETILEREFIRDGRPILALEDFNAVTYSMIRLPEADLIDDLEAKLARWDGKELLGFYDPELARKTGDEYWQAEHDWAQGNVAESFSLGFGTGALGRAFDDMLLDRRNRLWAEWIDKRMDDPGIVLLAVGAGHFEGEISLHVKLAERGFEVRRID